MDNPDYKKSLIQKKQELVHLKQQAKELSLKVRRRQYEYNHHYGISLAGVVMVLLFIETKPLPVFIGILGIGIFMVSVIVFVVNVGSKAARQLKETRNKITKLKCELIELEHS